MYHFEKRKDKKIQQVDSSSSSDEIEITFKMLLKIN